MIVTESEGALFCLFVDDLLGKQEVVIKSLDRRFKDVTGLAGCAILGDGRVGPHSRPGRHLQRETLNGDLASHHFQRRT